MMAIALNITLTFITLRQDFLKEAIKESDTLIHNNKIKGVGVI
jgi:hypothetical protein